ncbi:MAG: HpaII family restriction endonuclease [Cyclobacteriaceae bacterium]
MINQIEERKSTLITLKNRTFAEYSFVYRINDAYSINDLSKFHGKHQLLFQKLESKSQQLNLVFVDSVFANVLADVVLEVFLNEINSFNQYSISKSKIKLVDEKDESRYFKYKFFNFIHLLLYSDIATSNAFKGNEFSDRVYYFKNKFGELEYFSIYEQSKLQLKLLDELNLEIDFDSSSISDQMIKLCLKISY